MELLSNLFSENGALGGMVVLETVAIVYLWRDNKSLNTKLLENSEILVTTLSKVSVTIESLSKKIKSEARRK